MRAQRKVFIVNPPDLPSSWGGLRLWNQRGSAPGLEVQLTQRSRPRRVIGKSQYIAILCVHLEN